MNAVTGAVAETCTSLPWGDNLQCTGADQSPLHFTGKQRDSESGLDNFGARYNSSGLGRFMTPDWSATPSAVPFGNDSDPQSLNLYLYVRDNPLGRTDPSGHCDVDGETRGAFWCFAHLFGLVSTKKEDEAKQAQQRKANQPTTSSNQKSPGDHVFIKVAGGLGVGADVKVGPAKLGTEVSEKSEGKYELSGKSQISFVKEAEASATIAGYGPAAGYDSENTANYSKMTTGPPDGPVTQENNFGLMFKTPEGGSATFSSGSLSVEVGVCVVLCLSVGVGVQ